jgi:hypothetical protein
VPADVHAPTTLIVDIVPVAPGRDLVVPPGTPVTIPVRVSHHGLRPLAGTLHWTLNGLGGEAPVQAKPFMVSEPVAVTVTPVAPTGRLRLWLTDPIGERVAESFVDISTDAPD